MVIEIVLDWGKDSEVEELIRFYGFERVKMFVKDEPMYLMEHSLNRACKIFGLKEEETACYQRKVERGLGGYEAVNDVTWGDNKEGLSCL